jgi:RimJ/RimL family protein N-acetyltransferase
VSEATATTTTSHAMVPFLSSPCWRNVFTGAILSGRPEARYEAYARGYAGCGTYVLDTSYRRWYGRLYEHLVCQNHTQDDFFTHLLYPQRPYDIIGLYVRLEPLLCQRHLYDLYHATNGAPAIEYHKSYNPQDIWCFCEAGPFTTMEQMQQSYIFRHEQNTNGDHHHRHHDHTAALAIRHNVTHQLIGIVFLSHDEPQHLSIQLHLPIMTPKYNYTTKECLESCAVIMDRLFAYGYRRIQFSVDQQDIAGIQFVYRLGGTFEGCLYKHMVVKDANRNSNIYGLLNSDWKYNNSNTLAAVAVTSSSLSNNKKTNSISNSSSVVGTSSSTLVDARTSLFQKLYGTKVVRALQSHERCEAELEYQTCVLQQQKNE